MSTTKYAGLPDIDTAPDIYETEDVFPSSYDTKGDSSEDESGAPSRSNARGKNGEPPTKEELDSSSLMATDEASKRFKRAEKRQHRPRIQYTYPPSPTDSGRNSPIPATPALPLSQRLRRLEAELAAVEMELQDPSNPLLQKDKDVDPGELVKRMVNAKRRLDKISKAKEGRGKLVNALLGEVEPAEDEEEATEQKQESVDESEEKDVVTTAPSKGEVKDITEMDRRVGELEKIIGSSSATLDELSPLPPPLLPLLTKLNTQLTLLTQPRHIDSISRRLKLLLSDLDRVSAANSQQNSSQRRQTSSHGHTGSQPSTLPASANPTVSVLQEQLTPILTRLAPLLPHIPHILTRLRTLSSLHTSAAAFQSTLEGLEEEQKRGRAALQDLRRALDGVEKSLEDNETLVKNNVKGLEERVEDIGRRVDELQIAKE